MRTAAHGRVSASLLALSALACSRDLDLPSSTPPRIDTVAVVGLESQAVASGLPVLGGELVAIRGGGFPDEVAELDVRIGSEDAEVLETSPGRIVARMPALASYGPADLQVRTTVGFRTVTDAFRYDGAGQPSGFVGSDLDTGVDLAFVTPVQPPGTYGFSDFAVATGASDSALFIVPAVGLAAAAIPLGLVPSSAAAWIDFDPIAVSTRLNVLAVARGGGAALGTALLDGSSIRSRAEVRRLDPDPLVSTGPCALPQVRSTVLGTPVGAWLDADDRQWIATISEGAARAGAYAPAAGAAGIHRVPAGPISGWGPWGFTRIVFAAGNEIYAYDTATPLAPPQILTVWAGGLLPVSVSSLLAPGVDGCPASIDYFYTLATATTGTSNAIAVAYRAGNADRVALLDLGLGPILRSVASGIAGTVPASLSLVPDPPFAPTTAWAVLGAGARNLFRFRPLAGGPKCGDLVADAALPLSEAAGYLSGFGGMTPVVNGTRLLSTTADGDLVTVLPPSLTSAGSIVRFAAYGGVSIQEATIGDATIPIAIAEHSSHESSLSDLDTGSALLVVSLADHGSVALGGSGYGRGAVWLDPPGGGALAYTGDLRAAGLDQFERGGAASVTGFAAGECPGEGVRITASRPVTSGPDLLAQGPARSGAFGPEGTARFGPLAPPVYTVKGGWLHVYEPDPARLACLAGDGGAGPNWDPGQLGSCAPDAKIQLGVDPLDVTLSAGDRAAAIRTIQPCVGVSVICRIGDEVCERATCQPEPQIQIVHPDPVAPTSTVVPLPAPPAAVAADRGGGFLVTMRCETGSTSGGSECFSSDELCDRYLTAPDEENGALVLVREDGSGVECLAVQPALAGPVAVTPNGAEAWVSGTTAKGQFLVRLALHRRTSDGAIDTSRPADLVASELLHASPGGSGTPPPGGIAFTPDGSTGILTVPAEYRILLRE